MKKIILASTSPRRKNLLSKTGIVFEIVASDYEEDMTLNLTPHELQNIFRVEKPRQWQKVIAMQSS